MATELHVKDSGVWRECDEVHVKDGGVWREIDEVWIKDGGVWRQAYSAMVTPASVSVANISNTEYSDNTCEYVSGNTTAIPDPPDDGSYNYVWEKHTGDTISNSGTDENRTFGETYCDESESATYKVTVSNAKGSVSQTFTVNLGHVYDP